MPRLFKRILCFEAEGEIYDTETSPEEIIKNYDFHFRDFNDGRDRSFILMEHKDHRGKIITMNSRPKISKAKKPDTEYFII